MILRRSCVVGQRETIVSRCEEQFALFAFASFYIIISSFFQVFWI